MSTRRNLKYRYLKTKMALGQTIQSILDINRKRKVLNEDKSKREELQEELRVLNAVAENQAARLRTMEIRLSNKVEEAPKAIRS